jgi:hypothetical protein
VNYRLIGKLTVFFHLQEFNWWNLTFDRDQFHYRRSVFSSHLKSKVDNIVIKTVDLRVNLNIDDVSVVFYISHPPITLSNLSSVNLDFIFRCSSPPLNPVYYSDTKRVDLSTFFFSSRFSSHRHSYISFQSTLDLSFNNKQKLLWGSVGLILSKTSTMRISILLDLSSRSFIPLPCFSCSSRPTPLLAPSRILFHPCSV